MTTISTAIRFARLGIAASLLGAGLLIGSVQPGSAAEIATTPIATPLPHTQDASQSAPGTTPAQATPAQATPVQYSAPLLGAVGFGWG
jgi:hypothetical protein